MGRFPRVGRGGRNRADGPYNGAWGSECGTNGLIAAGAAYRLYTVKTIVYPIRLSDEDYALVQREAARRKKTLADLFRDLITYGLPALPPMPENYEALGEAWDSLGPAPEVIYDKLPKSW